MKQDVSFGKLIKEHRRVLDLTQAELARRVGCATITLRKIEADSLRPSVQIAERLAMVINIPLAERADFIRLARSILRDTPQPPPTPTPPPDPEEIGDEDLSGRAIRGYELGEKIGSGGFGAVYRAVQPVVEREVAIKIILPQYANHPDFIRRFEAEAQLVSRLEHPHIVPLYDYWREPNVACLVMRLLRSGNLGDRLRIGPLPLEFVVQVLAQIGAALHAAHRFGVIHRDLKPENVLLDEDNNAYLADFGIAKNLGDPNLEGKTKTGELVGSPAYVSPEQIRSDPIMPQADIYTLGVLLYELLTGVQPFSGPTPIDLIMQHLNEPLPSLRTHNPDLPATLDPVIRRATSKNPAKRQSDVLTFVAEFQTASGYTGLAVRIPTKGEEAELDEIDAETIENPYKGLRPFQEADADDFYGRDTLIQSLLGRMGEENDVSRFLAVVGPSGSGKSSVVKAGLIPALRRGGLPGSETWFVVDFMPGAHPLEELEAALLRIAVNPPTSLLGQLREDERGLLRAVHRVLPADEEVELVLVIDQFEEVFTLVEDEAERVHFLESLVSAALDPRSRLRVVITLRADFTDRPLQYVDFGDLVGARTEFVLPLTPDELELAITGPAHRSSMIMEPGLVARIVREVGNQPGALPLLQYALTELFERRDGRRLTLSAYQESGGVLGALGRRAEAIYNRFDERVQMAACQLFLRLVTLGEGVEDTRRRVLQSEIMALKLPGFENDPANSLTSAYTQVIDAFGRARLFSFDRDPLTRGPTVEVAHEALLQEWRRLRGWLDENRSDIRNQRLLAQAAKEWSENDQDGGYLLRGGRLDHFETWAQGVDIALTDSERAFLEASIAARVERQVVEAERQAHEQALEQRSRRFLQALVGVFAVAAIVAVILSIFAFNARATAQSEAFQRATAVVIAEQEREVAQEQTRLTLARELAFASVNSLSEDPERSVLLALEAIKTKEIIESTNALHQALPELSIIQTIGLGGYIDGLDFNPDGTRLALANQRENVISIWDVNSREKVTEFPFAVPSTGADISYSPDGRLVAASGRTGQNDLTLWDVESGELLRAWVSQPGAATTFEGTSSEIDFSPNGDRLAVANLDGVPQVLDVSTGESIFKLMGHQNPVGGLAYSPDGFYIATGDNFIGEVILWDAETGESLHLLEAGAMGIYNLAYSPDGEKLAAVGDDGVLHVWDAETGEELISQVSETAGYRAVVFSPDGQFIMTGGQDSTVRIWDAASGKNLKTLAGHTGVVISLDISPDGEILSSGGGDGALKFWDISPSRELFSVPSSINGIALRPGDITLVASGPNNSINQLDPKNGQPLGTFVHLNLDPGDGISRLIFTPDGRHLVVTLTLGDIQVFDFETGEVVATLAGHTAVVVGADITSDGQYLVTSSFDGKAILWDLTTGSLVTEYLGHGHWVLDVIFSYDEKQVITASTDGTIRVWDLFAGESLKTVPDTGGLGAIEITPDGSNVIGATIDGDVRIWDAATWEEIKVFRAHTSGTWDLALSADGTRLVTAGFEGNAKVWEIPSGRQIATLYGHQGNVTEVEISPDGKIVYTESWDGLLRAFLLDVDELVDLAQSRVTRSLTEEECQTYLHLENCPSE